MALFTSRSRRGFVDAMVGGVVAEVGSSEAVSIERARTYAEARRPDWPCSAAGGNERVVELAGAEFRLRFESS